MGTRRQARIVAVQGLYAWEETGADMESLGQFDWLARNISEEVRTFAILLMAGAIDNCTSIDGEIEKHLEHWSFDRLNKIDLAILRIGAYALMYREDIPASVTIDEAVEIAKVLGTNDSYRFVNGVLDGMRKAIPS